MRVFFDATTPQLPMYSRLGSSAGPTSPTIIEEMPLEKVVLIYASVEVYMLFRQKVHGGCAVIVHTVLLLLLI